MKTGRPENCFHCNETFPNSQSRKAHMQFCKVRRAKQRGEAPVEPSLRPVEPKGESLRLSSEPKAVESRTADESLCRTDEQAYSSSSSFLSEVEKKKGSPAGGSRLETPDKEFEGPEQDSSFLSSLRFVLKHLGALNGYQREIALKAQFQFFHKDGSRSFSKAQREVILESAFVLKGQFDLDDEVNPIDAQYIEQSWHPMRKSEPGHDKSKCRICIDDAARAKRAHEMHKQDLREAYADGLRKQRITQARYDELIAALETSS